MTTTSELDEGFTVDCPIIVETAHCLIIELYEDGGIFVLDVMDESQAKGTHWHPNNTQQAIQMVTDFMEGTCEVDWRSIDES